VPPTLEVHLILDNYATHKTPAIRRWLLRHPRFVLHFIPKSSSWLNLVERWFAELTAKKLKRGAHSSVEALEADITAWAEHWNANPRPYVWTKTADEILTNLARYCERISDSEHYGSSRDRALSLHVSLRVPTTVHIRAISRPRQS